MTGTKETVPDVRQAIESLDIFQDLDAESLAALLQSARVVRFPAPTIISQAGEPPATVFIIVRGRAAIQIPSERPGSALSAMTDIFSPGDCVGLVAALEDVPHMGAVAAVEDSVCLVVPRDDFLSILERSHVASFKLLRQLSGRVRHARTWLSKSL